MVERPKKRWEKRVRAVPEKRDMMDRNQKSSTKQENMKNKNKGDTTKITDN